jgi:hypothetical protein
MCAISAELGIAGELDRKQTVIVGLRTHATLAFVALHTKMGVVRPRTGIGPFPASCLMHETYCASGKENVMTMTEVKLADTAFGRLDAEGRLLNPVLKDPVPKPGHFGFRGDIALAFQEQFADEKRPPEYSIEQVLAIADAATGTISVLAGYLHNFAYLKDVGQVLGDMLSPAGTYVFFVNNIDFLKKYRVPLTPEIMAYVLPLDESTVWKETLELVDVDKNDVKKLGGAAKLQYVMDRVAAFTATYPEIGYEEGVATMEPVRNRNANRPV